MTVRYAMLSALALCAAQAFGIADAARFKFRKGINVSRLESWTDTTAGYLGENSTYAAIKSKGFDHVRFPVYFKNYYDSGSQTLKSNITVIDGVLDKCEANGLYVFLDFHGWSAINTTNGTDRVDFLKIWELVADRYRNRSDYVIFELINEPHTTEGGNLDAANLNALQAEVLPIIRATNPNRLVLLAAAEWNGPWKLSELTIPPNPGPIGVVCHTYGPMNFTHQGATWGGFSTDHVSFTSADKTETGTKDLDNAFRWIDDFQEKTGVPVVMNEFGVNKQNSKATDAETLDWTSYVARNCESNDIAWTWWEYNQGFGAYYQSNWWSGYQWRAPVMDGLFPAEPVGNTYADSFNASDYAKTMTISFPGYNGSSALAEFPALVKLSADIPGFDYADFQRTGGDDLRFTDAGGNLIPHEIDTWNPDGVSTVWVKIPSLTASTKIKAHYGCALPVAVDSATVWDSNYVGVWHLGEKGLPLRESSRSSTDFTKQDGSGIKYAQSGVVGGSVDFGASGKGRMLTAKDCDALDGFTTCTVEAWTYQTSNTTAAILSKRYAVNRNLSYFLYDNGAKTQFNVAASDSTSGNSAQLKPTLNQWAHQVYTFDSGTIRGYLDGAKAGSDKTLSFTKINASDGYLHLGNFNRNGAWNADARNFPGKIDEVRISKCVRSADWIKATHDTIANAAFATYTVDGIVPEEPPEPQVVSASDAAGFDYTNRLVTVTGLAAGETVTLSTARAGTTTAMTATADANGEAVFNVETAPGAVYSYAVSRDGTELASGGFVTGGWKSGGSWFRGAFAAGAPVASGGSWTGAPQPTADGNAVAGDAQFALDAAARAAGSEKFARVEFKFKCEGMDDEVSLAADLAPMFGGVSTVALSGGGTAWFAWDGAAWHRLYGDAAPEVCGAYVVRAELDLAASPKTVRYFVSSNGGGTFAPLFADAELADEWIACRAAPSDCVGEVAVEGALELASVAGALMGADVAEAEGAGYESLADALAAGGEVKLLTNATWPTNAPVGTVAVNQGGFALQGVALDGNGNAVVSSGHSAISGEGRINISLAQAAALGVATNGKTPAEIASALAADGANGIPLWKSYALGLDPSDPDSKPKAVIAVSGGKVELSLVGIDVNASSGATVTYRVYRFSDLADAEEEAVGGDRAASATAELQKDASEPRMFYRLRVDVKGY